MNALINNFKHLVTFVRVAESRGFTAAAHRLGISAAAVSKSITHLENEFGVKLINRTTRSLSLTDEGELLLEKCRSILLELQAAEALLTRTTHQPKGRLRLHAPVGMGRKLIIPALLELTRKYPELSINADFSDRTPNITEENFDALIRIGETSDSRLIARTLTRVKYLTCASNDYLKRHAIPIHPQDLHNHNCLAYAQWNTGRFHEWDYQKGNVRHIHIPQGSLNVNHPEAIFDAVMQGSGIARMASYIAAPGILSGELQVLLLDWTPQGHKVQLVYLPNRQLSVRIQALTEEIAKVLPNPFPWETEIAQLQRLRA